MHIFNAPARIISIHAPREGCDQYFINHTRGYIGISIHAPREGCDLLGRVDAQHYAISIHAPREGCDCNGTVHVPAISYFNPRTP